MNCSAAMMANSVSASDDPVLSTRKSYRLMSGHMPSACSALVVLVGADDARHVRPVRADRRLVLSIGDVHELLDEGPVDRAIPGGVVGERLQRLDRARIRQFRAFDELLDPRVDHRGIQLPVVQADNPADVAEVERLDDARRRQPRAAGVPARPLEHRMRRIDAGIDDGPGDLAAVDLEERPRRVSLHGGDRFFERR